MKLVTNIAAAIRRLVGIAVLIVLALVLVLAADSPAWCDATPYEQDRGTRTCAATR